MQKFLFFIILLILFNISKSYASESVLCEGEEKPLNEHIKVVILDDSRFILNFHQQLILQYYKGVSEKKILTFVDPTEFVHNIDCYPNLDLVLSDYDMGPNVVNGLDVGKKMKEKKPKVFTALRSGLQFEGSLLKSLEAYFDHISPKGPTNSLITFLQDPKKRSSLKPSSASKSPTIESQPMIPQRIRLIKMGRQLISRIVSCIKGPPPTKVIEVTS